MTVNDLIVLTAKTQAELPQLRAGQAAFNVVHLYRPAIASKVIGTPLDPFNHDSRLPAFWDFVEFELSGE